MSSSTKSGGGAAGWPGRPDDGVPGVVHDTKRVDGRLHVDAGKGTSGVRWKWLLLLLLLPRRKDMHSQSCEVAVVAGGAAAPQSAVQ